MNKKILLLAATALLAFACGKTEYPEYEWGPQDDTTVVKNEVFFINTADILEIDPTVDTVWVGLGRLDATEALSVPLIVNDPSGVFGVPETAEFAAGAATTVIEIILSKMELEKTYELSISLPSDFYYNYKKTSGAASSRINYHLSALKQQWDDAGTCTFYDFGEWISGTHVAENVAIQNHAGTDDYRIVNAYNLANEGALPEANILFMVVKNNAGEYVVDLPSGMQYCWGDIGYVLYWDTKNYAQYCAIEHIYDEGEHSFVIDYMGVTLSTMKLWLGTGMAFTWHDCPIEFPIPEAED